MGKAIRASALVLLLACTAQAGWMMNDRTPPPPPPPATAQPGQTTGDDVPTNTDGDIQNGAADGLTQTVLDLLAGVLTLV